MKKPPIQGCHQPCSSSAEHLNRDCFCATLNRVQLDKILGADPLNQSVLTTHPQLFSNTSVFISPLQLQQMQQIVTTITQIVNLPLYAEKVLAQAPSIAAYNFGTKGVFMGYDFHLSEPTPKIIEINTNAGGAFLNAALVNAHSECGRAAGRLLPPHKTLIDEQFVAMFRQEWALQRGNKPLTSIAIIDQNPQQQFLYPEFKMAQRLFASKGITSIIADPSELQLINGAVVCQGQIIDLVYNRLTDFSLADAAHQLLHSAYQMNAVVVTPNPHQHALYADKRNLAILSDPATLKDIAATASDISILQAGVAQTQQLSAENANELWAARKQLFFKPASGFGSRAAYRGDKLTKRVWADILQGDYVAQQLITPSERGILVDDCETTLKMDIRAYVYAGEIQLLAARLYQGQTTNFRTQGGGFAPVFVAQ